MAHIERGNIEAKLQRRDSDREVLESNDNALSRLLAFDAAYHPGRFEGNRMHGNIAAQPVDEGQPPLLVGIRFCAERTVHQFGDGHDREADVDLAVHRLYLLQDLPDGVWPRRSAAMTTLESRISPTPEDSRACGC